MHELDGIVRVERWFSGEHVVQRCAETIQVGAVIDGPADSAGLLRSDVGGTLWREHRGSHDTNVNRQTLRERQIENLHLASGAGQNRLRVDGADDEVPGMERGERIAKSECNLEELIE